jgi:RHS repeat-associated protein
VTNANGTVLDDSDFYPYGGERAVYSSSGNTYKFTGKERDTESTLDYFGTRYYSSQSGRFMSPDSGPYLWADPQSLNRYSYARNNPLKYIDPTGRYFVISPNDPHYGQFVIAVADMLLSNNSRYMIEEIANDPRPAFFFSGSVEDLHPPNITGARTDWMYSVNRPGEVLGSWTVIDFSKLSKMQRYNPFIDLNGENSFSHEIYHVYNGFESRSLFAAATRGAGDDDPRSQKAQKFADKLSKELSRAYSKRAGSIFDPDPFAEMNALLDFFSPIYAAINEAQMILQQGQWQVQYDDGE